MEALNVLTGNGFSTDERLAARRWWQRVPGWVLGLAAVAILAVAVLVAVLGPVWLRRWRMEQLAALPDVVIYDALEMLTRDSAQSVTFRSDDLWERLFGPDTWAVRDYAISVGRTFPRERLPLLESVRRVHTLTLSGDQFRDEDLQRVARLAGLRSLSLDAPGISPAGLRHLAGSGLTKLSFLHTLYGPDHLAEGIRALPGLEELHLERTRATDDWLVPLRGHPHLRDVNLWGTQVSDEGLKILGTLPKLEWLSLAETRITDAGLSALPASLTLSALVLTSTDISDEGLARLLVDPVRLDLNGTRVRFEPHGVDWMVSRKRLKRVSAIGTREPPHPEGLRRAEAHGLQVSY